MPLNPRSTLLVSVLLAASIADAQTTPLAPAGGKRANNFVAVRDLNMAIGNSDTVVTTTGASRVTLGLRLLNKIDERLINQFKRAWAISKAGYDPTEGVVVVFLMRSGGYVGQSPGVSNEFEQASFKWNPATVAIVHTHPNAIDPRPSRIDEATADNLGVPVFTITSRGMYCYNPTTRETTRVMDDLDWLESSKWASRALRHPTLVDEYSDLRY
jgi:hypothetical protein